jgi:hypothetical protein
MSIGTILVAIALVLVVGAYLARPFRQTAGSDREIEAWVAQVKAERRSKGAGEKGSGGAT